MPNPPAPRKGTFKERLHEIIFEADTPAGKAFDVLLLVAITLSVLVVVLESVEGLHQQYAHLFTIVEWVFTVLFSIEYLLRLYSVKRPIHYARSFYGIIDLLAIMPTYLSLFFPGSQYLLTIRALRLLRIFRVFKISRYLQESSMLVRALINSRIKISIFLFAVFMIVLIAGSAMYFIEGSSNPGFSSIPRSMYWAIVTVTTVGYGDISPTTVVGQGFAALLMMLGYAIIAVPTGIVSSEMVRTEMAAHQITTQHCPNCLREGHEADAVHCKYCGEKL